MSDWRAIDSAPKDGTWFLAWNGFWHILGWIKNARAESEGEFLTSKMEHLYPPATHWAPGALIEGPE